MKRKIYFIQLSITNEILDKRIQALGAWYKVFDGWLVHSALTSKEIYESLAKDYESYRSIIFEITDDNYYGYYDPKLWEWLNKNSKSKAF